MSGYIAIGNGRFHYLKMGSGKRLLICFHGYGNNASLFYPFEHYLGKDFTIISVDLPHHGKTEWRLNTLLQPKELMQFVHALMEEYSVADVALLGYSIGGRVCLAITELMPQYIDKVLLIASDGLVFNPLYFTVTRTLPGRRFFKSFLTEPKRYVSLFDWMQRKKWIDQSRYKFAMHYLGSERERSLLFNVWNNLSLLVPRMKRLKSAIKTHHLPLYIFMGSHDKIIPVKNAKHFIQGLDSAQLFIVEKGHRVFDNDTLPQMANCLITGVC